jgi:hypothetical protein
MKNYAIGFNSCHCEFYGHRYGGQAVILDQFGQASVKLNTAGVITALAKAIAKKMYDFRFHEVKIFYSYNCKN